MSRYVKNEEVYARLLDDSGDSPFSGSGLKVDIQDASIAVDLDGKAGTDSVLLVGADDQVPTNKYYLQVDATGVLQSHDSVLETTANAIQTAVEGTLTVQATNLDVRDLTNASDSILVYGSDDGGTTKRVLTTDASGNLQVDVLTAPSTVVTATDLDIRDLTATDVVTAQHEADSTEVWTAADTVSPWESSSHEARYMKHITVYGNSSANSTLTAQFSPDASTWYNSSNQIVDANGDFEMSFVCCARYVRLKGTADSTITALIDSKA